jgi:cobalamin-dependent methionine synthase I
VVDLGKGLEPEAWLECLDADAPDALAVSVMRRESLARLQRLLESLRRRDPAPPVVVGGIAVNGDSAWELADSYGLPVRYGRDVHDAEGALRKALAREPADIPPTPRVEEPMLLT